MSTRTLLVLASLLLACSETDPSGAAGAIGGPKPTVSPQKKPIPGTLDPSKLDNKSVLDNKSLVDHKDIIDHKFDGKVELKIDAAHSKVKGADQAVVGEKGSQEVIGEKGPQALIGEDGSQALIGEDGSQAIIGEEGSNALK